MHGNVTVVGCLRMLRCKVLESDFCRMKPVVHFLLNAGLDTKSIAGHKNILKFSLLEVMQLEGTQW